MAIRKSTGIFHFTWLQQNLCCERPQDRQISVTTIFLIAGDRRNLRHNLDSLAATFYCSLWLLILSAPSKSQHDRQSLFVCFSVNYFKYNVCSLHTPHIQPQPELFFQLIFHFPIRFPFAFTTPSSGSHAMITHFRVEYWKRVYRVSVASGLYKHNCCPFRPGALWYCLCTSEFLSSACLVVFLSFLQIYESHTKARWRDQIVPPLD